MHNGWPLNWAILLKTEKRKATGHDTSSKKRYRENLMKIGPKRFRYDNEKQLMR